MVHDPEVAEARAAVDAALGTLRDALHRRGRLASRNEALDEIARLLFAHVTAQLDGGDGISARALAARPEATPAARLRGFVADVHARHLPASVTGHLGPDDVTLRLKPQEDALAGEIVACFEQLHAVEATRSIGGEDGIDVLNDVFGRFLADSFADEKELGQYLTPVEVVEFMVRLALGTMTGDERRSLASPGAATGFGAVLDPACGVGSFLTEFVRVAGAELAPDDVAGRRAWRHAVCREVVVGIDKSDRMIRFALGNMALFRFPAGRLHLANALALDGPDATVTQPLEGTAGLILTNPPFGASFSGPDLAGYRVAGDWASKARAAVDAELLFVERCLAWLRPGGQLVAVVPDSVLTNRGPFRDLRRGIAPEVELLSVTSLPPVTFAPAGTSTKTSVLHLRKRSGDGRPRARRTTAFAVCDDVGYTVTRRDSRRLKRHGGGGELPAILEALLDRSDDGRCRAVADVEAAPRWDAGFHASLPQDVHDRLAAASADDVRLGDVAVVATTRVDPRRLEAPTFAYIEIADVDGRSLSATSKPVAREDAPGRARKPVRAGDVLLSTVRPERRAVAVVRDDQDGAVATTGFAVVRPTGIHPLVLAKLLQSELVTAQLLRSNVGIAYPVIDESCLAGLLLPISRADLARLDADADELLAAEAALARRRAGLGELVDDLARNWAVGAPTRPAPARAERTARTGEDGEAATS